MAKKSKFTTQDMLATAILLGMAVVAFKKPSISGKYLYEKVLQSNHGYGWDDEISVATDSTGWIKDQQERAEWKENVRLYRENTRGAIRVINRKTKL